MERRVSIIIRGRRPESASECEEGEQSQHQNARKERRVSIRIRGRRAVRQNVGRGISSLLCHSSYVLPAVMARRGPFNVAYIWIMEQYKIHIIFAIIPT